MSRERQIQGAAVALKALLSGHDPVQPPDPVPAHGTTGRGTRGGTKSGPSRGFLAYLSISVFFVCLAWFAAGSSGGRFVTPQGTQPGFRSQADGSGAIQNRPAGPEQDVMRFDARSFAVVMASSLSGATLAQAPVEWKVSEGGNGHWYQLVISGPTTWSAARTASEERGGHLVTVALASEEAFIAQLAARASHPTAWVDDQAVTAAGPWLGGYQPLGASSSQPWAWVNGEPWNWTGWATGEPNGGFRPGEAWSCMLGFAGRNDYRGWADATSIDFPQYPLPVSFIVEWDADCNNDGLVDYGQIRRGQLADYNGNNIPDCCEQGEPCTIGNFPVEWKKSEGGNGHWYRGRPSATARSAASWRSDAQAAGAHLVTIVTQRESTWLDLLIDQDALWPSSYVGPIIGLAVDDENCKSGCWDTGELLDWTNWWPGNPDLPARDGSVCLFDRGSRQWQNYPEGGGDFGGLATPRSTIFEWSADCDADGMVDYGQILRGDQLDRDQNGVPDSCQCATNASLAICCTSDLDLDGEVGASDISVLLLSFGDPRWMAPALDLDGDGEIGGGDLSFVLLDLGPCS
ncbi:MAG: C-type lectin domain-containing protein [Phycisphaerales bacterium]